MSELLQYLDQALSTKTPTRRVMSCREWSCLPLRTLRAIHTAPTAKAVGEQLIRIGLKYDNLSLADFGFRRQPEIIEAVRREVKETISKLREMHIFVEDYCTIRTRDRSYTGNLISQPDAVQLNNKEGFYKLALHDDPDHPISIPAFEVQEVIERSSDPDELEYQHAAALEKLLPKIDDKTLKKLATGDSGNFASSLDSLLSRYIQRFPVVEKYVEKHPMPILDILRDEQEEEKIKLNKKLEAGIITKDEYTHQIRQLEDEVQEDYKKEVADWENAAVDYLVRYMESDDSDDQKLTVKPPPEERGGEAQAAKGEISASQLTGAPGVAKPTVTRQKDIELTTDEWRQALLIYKLRDLTTFIKGDDAYYPSVNTMVKELTELALPVFTKETGGQAGGIVGWKYGDIRSVKGQSITPTMPHEELEAVKKEAAQIDALDRYLATANFSVRPPNPADIKKLFDNFGIANKYSGEINRDIKQLYDKREENLRHIKSVYLTYVKLSYPNTTELQREIRQMALQELKIRSSSGDAEFQKYPTKINEKGDLIIDYRLMAQNIINTIENWESAQGAMIDRTLKHALNNAKNEEDKQRAYEENKQALKELEEDYWQMRMYYSKFAPMNYKDIPTSPVDPKLSGEEMQVRKALVDKAFWTESNYTIDKTQKTSTPLYFVRLLNNLARNPENKELYKKFEYSPAKGELVIHDSLLSPGQQNTLAKAGKKLERRTYSLPNLDVEGERVWWTSPSNPQREANIKLALIIGSLAERYLHNRVLEYKGEQFQKLFDDHGRAQEAPGQTEWERMDQIQQQDYSDDEIMQLLIGQKVLYPPNSDHGRWITLTPTEIWKLIVELAPSDPDAQHKILQDLKNTLRDATTFNPFDIQRESRNGERLWGVFVRPKEGAITTFMMNDLSLVSGIANPPKWKGLDRVKVSIPVDITNPTGPVQVVVELETSKIKDSVVGEAPFRRPGTDRITGLKEWQFSKRPMAENAVLSNNSIFKLEPSINAVKKENEYTVFTAKDGNTYIVKAIANPRSLDNINVLASQMPQSIGEMNPNKAVEKDKDGKPILDADGKPKLKWKYKGTDGKLHWRRYRQEEWVKQKLAPFKNIGVENMEDFLRVLEDTIMSTVNYSIKKYTEPNKKGGYQRALKMARDWREDLYQDAAMQIYDVLEKDARRNFDWVALASAPETLIYGMILNDPLDLKKKEDQFIHQQIPSYNITMKILNPKREFEDKTFSRKLLAGPPVTNQIHHAFTGFVRETIKWPIEAKMASWLGRPRVFHGVYGGTRIGQQTNQYNKKFFVRINEFCDPQSGQVWRFNHKEGIISKEEKLTDPAQIEMRCTNPKEIVRYEFDEFQQVANAIYVVLNAYTSKIWFPEPSDLAVVPQQGWKKPKLHNYRDHKNLPKLCIFRRNPEGKIEVKADGRASVYAELNTKEVLDRTVSYEGVSELQKLPDDPQHEYSGPSYQSLIPVAVSRDLIDHMLQQSDLEEEEKQWVKIRYGLNDPDLDMSAQMTPVQKLPGYDVLEVDGQSLRGTVLGFTEDSVRFRDIETGEDKEYPLNKVSFHKKGLDVIELRDNSVIVGRITNADDTHYSILTTDNEALDLEKSSIKNISKMADEEYEMSYADPKTGMTFPWPKKISETEINKYLPSFKKKYKLTDKPWNLYHQIPNTEKLTYTHNGETTVGLAHEIVRDYALDCVRYDGIKAVLRTHMGSIDTPEKERQLADLTYNAYLNALGDRSVSMYCSKCKKTIPGEEKLCPKCQSELNVRRSHDDFRTFGRHYNINSVGAIGRAEFQSLLGRFENNENPWEASKRIKAIGPDDIVLRGLGNLIMSTNILEMLKTIAASGDPENQRLLAVKDVNGRTLIQKYTPIQGEETHQEEEEEVVKSIHDDFNRKITEILTEAKRSKGEKISPQQLKAAGAVSEKPEDKPKKPKLRPTAEGGSRPLEVKKSLMQDISTITRILVVEQLLALIESEKAKPEEKRNNEYIAQLETSLDGARKYTYNDFVQKTAHTIQKAVRKFVWGSSTLNYIIEKRKETPGGIHGMWRSPSEVADIWNKHLLEVGKYDRITLLNGQEVKGQIVQKIQEKGEESGYLIDVGKREPEFYPDKEIRNVDRLSATPEMIADLFTTASKGKTDLARLLSSTSKDDSYRAVKTKWPGATPAQRLASFIVYRIINMRDEIPVSDDIDSMVSIGTIAMGTHPSIEGRYIPITYEIRVGSGDDFDLTIDTNGDRYCPKCRTTVKGKTLTCPECAEKLVPYYKSRLPSYTNELKNIIDKNTFTALEKGEAKSETEPGKMPRIPEEEPKPQVQAKTDVGGKRMKSFRQYRGKSVDDILRALELEREGVERTIETILEATPMVNLPPEEGSEPEEPEGIPIDLRARTPITQVQTATQPPKRKDKLSPQDQAFLSDYEQQFKKLQGQRPQGQVQTIPDPAKANAIKAVEDGITKLRNRIDVLRGRQEKTEKNFEIPTVTRLKKLQDLRDENPISGFYVKVLSTELCKDPRQVEALKARYGLKTSNPSKEPIENPIETSFIDNELSSKQNLAFSDSNYALKKKEQFRELNQKNQEEAKRNLNGYIKGEQPPQAFIEVAARKYNGDINQVTGDDIRELAQATLDGINKAQRKLYELRVETEKGLKNQYLGALERLPDTIAGQYIRKFTKNWLNNLEHSREQGIGLKREESPSESYIADNKGIPLDQLEKYLEELKIKHTAALQSPVLQELENINNEIKNKSLRIEKLRAIAKPQARATEAALTTEVQALQKRKIAIEQKHNAVKEQCKALRAEREAIGSVLRKQYSPEGIEPEQAKLGATLQYKELIDKRVASLQAKINSLLRELSKLQAEDIDPSTEVRMLLLEEEEDREKARLHTGDIPDQIIYIKLPRSIFSVKGSPEIGPESEAGTPGYKFSLKNLRDLTDIAEVRHPTQARMRKALIGGGTNRLWNGEWIDGPAMWKLISSALTEKLRINPYAQIGNTISDIVLRNTVKTDWSEDDYNWIMKRDRYKKPLPKINIGNKRYNLSITVSNEANKMAVSIGNATAASWGVDNAEAAVMKFIAENEDWAERVSEGMSIRMHARIKVNPVPKQDANSRICWEATKTSLPSAKPDAVKAYLASKGIKSKATAQVSGPTTYKIFPEQMLEFLEMYMSKEVYEFKKKNGSNEINVIIPTRLPTGQKDEEGNEIFFSMNTIKNLKDVEMYRNIINRNIAKALEESDPNGKMARSVERLYHAPSSDYKKELIQNLKDRVRRGMPHPGDNSPNAIALVKYLEKSKNEIRDRVFSDRFVTNYQYRGIQYDSQRKRSIEMRKNLFIDAFRKRYNKPENEARMVFNTLTRLLDPRIVSLPGTMYTSVPDWLANVKRGIDADKATELERDYGTVDIWQEVLGDRRDNLTNLFDAIAQSKFNAKVISNIVRPDIMIAKNVRVDGLGKIPKSQWKSIPRSEMRKYVTAARTAAAREFYKNYATIKTLQAKRDEQHNKMLEFAQDPSHKIFGTVFIFNADAITSILQKQTYAQFTELATKENAVQYKIDERDQWASREAEILKSDASLTALTGFQTEDGAKTFIFAYEIEKNPQMAAIAADAKELNDKLTAAEEAGRQDQILHAQMVYLQNPRQFSKEIENIDPVVMSQKEALANYRQVRSMPEESAPESEYGPRPSPEREPQPEQVLEPPRHSKFYGYWDKETRDRLRKATASTPAPTPTAAATPTAPAIPTPTTTAPVAPTAPAAPTAKTPEEIQRKKEADRKRLADALRAAAGVEPEAPQTPQAPKAPLNASLIRSKSVIPEYYLRNYAGYVIDNLHVMPFQRDYAILLREYLETDNQDGIINMYKFFRRIIEETSFLSGAQKYQLLEEFVLRN